MLPTHAADVTPLAPPPRTPTPSAAAVPHVAASGELHGIALVAHMMRHYGLAAYIDKLDDLGYDDWDFLLSLTDDEERTSVARMAEMKAGHLRKFVDVLSGKYHR